MNKSIRIFKNWDKAKEAMNFEEKQRQTLAPFQIAGCRYLRILRSRSTEIIFIADTVEHLNYKSFEI